MKMNGRMKALYASLKSTEAEDSSCMDSGLLALLESGFAQANGAVLLKAQQNLAKGATPGNFPDLTGYECFVNHIHVEDYLRDTEPHLEPRRTLKHGFVFAHRLLENLSSSFPDKPFTVILAFSESGCSVRFHSTRSGEEWLSDDLDRYDREALLVLETSQ